MSPFTSYSFQSSDLDRFHDDTRWLICFQLQQHHQQMLRHILDQHPKPCSIIRATAKLEPLWMRTAHQSFNLPTTCVRLRCCSSNLCSSSSSSVASIRTDRLICWPLFELNVGRNDGQNLIIVRNESHPVRQPLRWWYGGGSNDFDASGCSQ